jgi:large repetitive protein
MMWSRDRVKSLALATAAALAAVMCSRSDKPAADASKAASTDSAAPSAAAESQTPSQPAASIPASAADGPGLHRGRVDALKLPVPRSLDLSHVDPAQFAAALGRDPGNIFTYVRDNIAFEPYTGALRGPRGTLLAMAGNSIDRAALLAAMLASSKQKVRFVHGTLPQPDAERLVTSIWVEHASPDAKTGGESSPELRAAGEQFMAAIQRDGKLIRDLLQRAGRPAQSGQPVTRESLTAETQDHYWVESSPDGRSWTAMDPSFASAKPGQVFAEPSERFDTIPDAMYHHVELRVRTEEAVGGGVVSHEVLKYSARAADLSGADVFLGHDVGKGAEANHVRPFLVVRPRTIDGEWFWLKPPTAGNAPVTMVDALGGSAQEVVGTALAEYIELDFANPDGSGETVVREVFDRIGKHRRKAGTALTDEQIAAATGSVAVADFGRNLYDLFFTTGAIDRAHLTHLAARPKPTGDRLDVAAGLHRVGVAYTAMSDAMTSRMVAPSGAVARLYLDTPRVAIVEFARVNGKRRLGLDLRRERVRAAIPGFRKDQLFLAQVLRGIADGTLERVVTGASAGGRLADPGNAVFGTSLVFELAQTQKVGALLLTQEGPTLRDDLPEDGRARVEESLAAGNLVIAPERAIQVAGASRYAWWQIEPRTGATTAVTDEGLYQAAVEAAIAQVVEGAIVRTEGRSYVFFQVTEEGGGAMAEHVYCFANDSQASLFFNHMMGLWETAGYNTFYTLL